MQIGLLIWYQKVKEFWFKDFLFFPYRTRNKVI